MEIVKLFKKIRPYVAKYRTLVIGTLLLTLVGSFAAQVNAWILRYTVDGIDALSDVSEKLEAGWQLLIFIAVVLLIKEVVNVFVQFGQKFYGEKLRIYVSKDLAQ